MSGPAHEPAAAARRRREGSTCRRWPARTTAGARPLRRPSRSLEAIVAHVRSIVPQALLLADRVADRAALERVAAAGFDLVQGYEPRPRHRTQGVHPSQTVALRLLAVLSDEDSTAGQIEQIVAVDPGLSVRVLTTVNSAAGAGRQIASLRQALGLLGRRQAQRLGAARRAGRPRRQRPRPDDRRPGPCPLLRACCTPTCPASTPPTPTRSACCTASWSRLGVDAAQARPRGQARRAAGRRAAARRGAAGRGARGHRVARAGRHGQRQRPGVRRLAGPACTPSAAPSRPSTPSSAPPPDPSFAEMRGVVGPGRPGPTTPRISA
nr:HDOD domain-containing protein [Angustibacter aerolatus]